MPAQKRTIAIVSGKGGVGKSTLSVALAAIAARSFRRVVLIDTDPVGGATYASGLDPANIELGLADVLAGKASVDRALVVTAEGYFVLAATPTLIAEEANARKTFAKTRSGTAEIVLIDTPPGLSPLTQAAIDAADDVIIPVVAEPLATRTVEYALGLLDGLGARSKFRGIVPMMYEPRRLLSTDQLEELKKLGPVLEPVPRGVAAAESVLAGRSVVAYAPRSAPAVAIETLAASLNLKPCDTM